MSVRLDYQRQQHREIAARAIDFCIATCQMPRARESRLPRSLAFSDLKMSDPESAPGAVGEPQRRRDRRPSVDRGADEASRGCLSLI